MAANRMLDQIDRRFFRERYNAQQILLDIVEEVRKAATIEQVAGRVVTPDRCSAHRVRRVARARADQTAYHRSPQRRSASRRRCWWRQQRLVGLLRLLGKPLRDLVTESSWLRQRLPAHDTEIIRRAGIDLFGSVSLSHSNAKRC